MMIEVAGQPVEKGNVDRLIVNGVLGAYRANRSSDDMFNMRPDDFTLVGDGQKVNVQTLAECLGVE